MIDLNPDHVLLVASGLWVAAALATGLPERRIPSDYPFLFSLIAACAALVGFGDFLPPSGDAAITIVGVLLFTITPVVMTVKLYRSYPPREPGRHETVSDGDGDGGGGGNDGVGDWRRFASERESSPSDRNESERETDDTDDDTRPDGGRRAADALGYVEGVRIKRPFMTRGGSSRDDEDSDS